MNVSNVLSPTAQAMLLLTSHFSKSGDNKVKPLSTTEWAQFALWLKEQGCTPADLLTTNPDTLLKGWQSPRINISRILELLSRGHSLALAMEKWQRTGLWVVTRSDPDYPHRLKQQLKNSSPPVLFGCGNKTLLNTGGLAVIGSRNANNADLAFTKEVGAKAAAEGVTIVSGGARGVDEAAMLGALQQSGPVIGVLADSLLKAATSSKWRKGLMDNHMVLVSPFYPEAGFSVGNAMTRNKYIYCLADSSLVIHSGKKGGTLSGAEENLKNSWVPLWVKPTADPDAANADLAAKGGLWLNTELPQLEITDLIRNVNVRATPSMDTQTDLFSNSGQTELFTVAEKAPSMAGSSPKSDADLKSPERSVKTEASVEPINFYQLFLSELQQLAQNPITTDELMKYTKLHKSQLNEWLKRAVADNLLKKLARPVRYQVANKQLEI